MTLLLRELLVYSSLKTCRLQQITRLTLQQQHRLNDETKH